MFSQITFNSLPKNHLSPQPESRSNSFFLRNHCLLLDYIKTVCVSLREDAQRLRSAKGQTCQKQKPRLLEQVHQAIRRLHYSRRTEKAYVGWIKKFIYWSGKRHPATLGAPEVSAFLSYLATERNVAAATQMGSGCLALPSLREGGHWRGRGHTSPLRPSTSAHRRLQPRQ